MHLIPVLSLLAAHAAAAAGPGCYIVEDVNVIPMNREVVLTHQSVVVRDGIIERVGSVEQVAVPPDAKRISGRGRFLLPGLVDFHTHVQSPEELLAYLAYGFTSVVNLNGAARYVAWQHDSASPSFTGARLFTSSPTLDGFPPTTTKFIALASPEAGREAVIAQKDAGYGLIKIYSSVSPDVFDAISAAGAAEHIAVVGHIPRLVGAARAMRGGEVMIAHAEEFLQDLFDEATHSFSDARIVEMAVTAAETKVVVVPNLSAFQFIIDQVEDLRAVLARPEMRYVSPPAYHELISSNNRYTSRENLDEFKDQVKTALAAEKKLTRALSDADVPLLLGTDASTVGIPGWSGIEEIRLLTESGLSPFQVLRAGTSAAGEFLRRWMSISAPLGTVTEGAAADLLLLPRNPLQEPTAVGKALGVFSRGRWLPASEISRLRTQAAARYPAIKRLIDRFDALVHAKRPLEATQLFESEAPRFGKAPLLKFDVLYSQGRDLLGENPVTALPYLELAVRLFPDEVSLHNNLGEARKAAGDPDGARREYAAAQRLCPQDETARRGLATLEPK